MSARWKEFGIFLTFQPKFYLFIASKLGRQARATKHFTGFLSTTQKQHNCILLAHDSTNNVNTLFCLFAGGAAIDGEGGLARHGQSDLLFVARNLHTYNKLCKVEMNQSNELYNEKLGWKALFLTTQISTQ